MDGADDHYESHLICPELLHQSGTAGVKPAISQSSLPPAEYNTSSPYHTIDDNDYEFTTSDDTDSSTDRGFSERRHHSCSRSPEATA